MHEQGLFPMITPDCYKWNDNKLLTDEISISIYVHGYTIYTVLKQLGFRPV